MEGCQLFKEPKPIKERVITIDNSWLKFFLKMFDFEIGGNLMTFSYLDYSKSESDKREVSKKNSSGNQAFVYGNEPQSDLLKRRLSFDVSGDSILSTGGNQRKSPNPLNYEASGKCIFQ